MTLPKHKHRLWERILVLSWLVLLWGLAASLYHGTSAELLSGPFALVAIGVLGAAATLAAWASLGGRETTSGKDLVRALGTRVGAFVVVLFCNGLGLYLVLHSSVRELYVLTCTPANATVVVEGRPTLAKCGQPNFLSADNVLAAYAPGYAPDPARAVMDRDRDADYHISLELRPLAPWSCAAPEPRELIKVQEIEQRCTSSGSDAPAWHSARSYHVTLDAAAPQLAEPRRLFARTPDGIGVGLRAWAPKECVATRRVPAADPSSSEVLLGVECATQSAEQRERIEVELTLCAVLGASFPALEAVELLLTEPSGSTQALTCSDASP